jgi:hypothetical protein
MSIEYQDYVSSMLTNMGINGSTGRIPRIEDLAGAATLLARLAALEKQNQQLAADLKATQALVEELKTVKDQAEYQQWCASGMPGLIQLPGLHVEDT